MVKLKAEWFSTTNSKILILILMTDLGRPRRNGKSPGKKTVPWEPTAWENAC